MWRRSDDELERRVVEVDVFSETDPGDGVDPKTMLM